MSGVSSSPTSDTCKSSLLAGVSDVFFFLGVLPFLSQLLIDPSHMSLNNEMDVKLEKISQAANTC